LLDGDGELRRAARLIRDFHDAVAGFTPPPGAQWQVLIPADGHEIIEQQRLDIIPLLPRRIQAMHDFLAQQAAQGAQPWARLWDEGHGDAWRADADYIAEHEHQWRQALIG
jgi:hypothetical protein